MKNSFEYDVDVKETSKHYNVVVKAVEKRTTRNTRVGFNPLKLLQGKGLGLRVYAGRKKTETILLDTKQISLDKSNWREQLDKWISIEGLVDIKDTITTKISNLEWIKNRN